MYIFFFFYVEELYYKLNYHDQKIVIMRIWLAIKVETAIQWFCMLHAVLARFSGHGNSIYNIIPLSKK